MEPFTRTLFAEKKTWTASATSILKLPLDRYLSELILRFKATYDTAGSPTKAQDGVLNLVKRITLFVNGTAIRSWAPARYWYTKPLDLGAKPEFVDVTTTVASGKTASFVLPIHFRLDATNDQDVSCLLPLRYLSTAELHIEWAAATVFGTAQTIVSGEVLPTLKELVLTSSEEIQFYGAVGDRVVQAGTGLLKVIESEVTKTVDAAYTDFGFPVDLPSGMILTRSFVFATLAGVRSDALVDKLRLRQQSPTRVDLHEEDFLASQARDMQEYSFPSPIEGDRYLTGFTVLDYADIGTLDLRGRKAGDVQFQATVAAPSGTTNIVFIHEQVGVYA